MRAPAALSAAALAAFMAACGPTPVVVVPVDASDRLAAAGALVAEGCFDCLSDALDQFEQIAAIPHLMPASASGAAAGIVRVATLLNLRERELGMLDDGALQKAQAVLAAHSEVAVQLGKTVDIVDSVAWR